MLLLLLLSCYLRVPDPAASHHRSQRRFYEGWYLRVTDAAQGESFGIIHGIAWHPALPDGGEGYAIVLSAADDAAAWTRVPLDQARAPFDVYEVGLGEGDRVAFLSAEAASGSLSEGEVAVAWDLQITPLRGWERRGRDSPMGWVLRWRGFQTYWHVTQLQARVSGTLSFGGRQLRFDDALGYVERNWGRVFPKDWMWLQAGSFTDPQTGLPRDAALSVSGGSVPIVGPLGTRAGIVGWYDGDRLHHFATHTGQRVKLDYEPGRWSVRARGRGEQVEVQASIDPARLVPIVGPTKEGVQDVAIESLGGSVEVVLSQRKRPFGRWKEVDRAISELAGVEVGGVEAVEAAAEAP